LLSAIPFELEHTFSQHLEIFRLQADPKLGFVLQHRLGESWRNLYAFSLEEQYPADYQMMHYYTSTSPTSLFTQHVVCTLPTEEERFILYDAEFKVRGRDETSTISLEDNESYRE